MVKHFVRAGRGRRIAVLVALGWLLAFAPGLRAQQLRYDQHREIRAPDYATIRMGAFYSRWAFLQSVGYRYTRSEGTGTDYLFGTSRGVILEDGSEYPLISRLVMRNYLIITPKMDLDLSVEVSYRYYPMDTQEDEFLVRLPPEGILGNVSTEIRWTDFIRSVVYDDFVYRTDYIDTRGLSDRYGGTAYEYLRNELGVRTDWLMAKDKNLSLDLSRTDLLPQDDEFADQESVTYSELLAYEQQVLSGVVVGARARARQVSYTATDRPDASIQDLSVFAQAGFGEAEEVAVGIRPTRATTVTLGLGAAVGGSVSFARTERRSTYGEVDLQRIYESESARDTVSLVAEARVQTRLRKDLDHSLTYERGLRGGFLSAFEEYDTLEYRVDYKGAFTSLALFSRWSNIRPSASALNEYSDWTSGLNWTYPLSRAVDLKLSSVYSVRENDTLLTATGEPELDNDYETWTTRAGTGFRLTRSIDFDAYVEHVERTSDAADLAYTRDTVAATLTYRHDF